PSRQRGWPPQSTCRGGQESASPERRPAWSRCLMLTDHRSCPIQAKTLANTFVRNKIAYVNECGQALAGSTSGTITLCAVPVISMQRHVEGRCGTEFGPLKVS